MSSPAAAKPNPNARLLLFRKYHSWFGLATGLLVVVIALTGIYLNHKDTFRLLVGAAPKEKDHDDHKEPPAGTRPGVPTGAELAALPVGLTQAVDAAAPHLDGKPIEKVELRAEGGRLIYKVKAAYGPEVVIDAGSGAASVKAEKAEKPKPDRGERAARGGDKPKPDGGPKPPKAEGEPQPETAAAITPVEVKRPGGMDWGKAIKDLHTGKIGGDAGKLLVDAAALGLILLTVTGVYLWAVPELRKRRSARQRAAADAARAAAHAAPTMAS